MVRQRQPTRRPIPLAVLALTYLVAVLFLPILGFEFVDFDVNNSVVDNPHIRGLTGENLKHIFTSRCITSYYPVRTLTYALDYSLWGLNPRRFKLTNGLIHWANVMLMFWLILRTLPGSAEIERERRPGWWNVWAAALPAGLFAIHPVVVEPVAWVAGREELLMTLGALACFHFHLSARRLSLGGGKTGRVLACHVAAAVGCAAACLSNAVAAVIPLLIVAWDMLTLTGPKWRRILAGTAALWVIALVTVAAKGPGTDAVLADDVGVLTAQRLMLILNVYWRNLTTLVWPTGLSISYGPLGPGSFLDTEVVLGGVAACLTCLAIWRLRARKSILFGLLWFCLALTPTAQILPHHVHRADRFLYLPLVGLALALAAGIKPLGALLRSRAAVAATVALGLMILLLLDLRSTDQVQTWRDSVTMWENCVEVCPDSAFAHDVLARNLARRGELNRSEEHARRSLELDFIRNHEALCNRAMGLALFPDLGLPDREEAVQLARRACELTEWKDLECLYALATAYCSVANAQVEGGEFASALENYHKSIEADEQYHEALFNLAVLLLTCRDQSVRNPEEAVRMAELGCKVLQRPTPDRLSILSQAHVAAGRLEMAIATAEKAIGLAQAAGDVRMVEQIRRWVKEQRDRSTAQSNVVGGESETTPAPDPSILGPADD